MHLNSMARCLLDILADHIAIEEWHEGDIIITNDPYSGGQHLPDILTFKPVFPGRQADRHRRGVGASPGCRRRRARQLPRRGDGDFPGGLPHPTAENRRGRGAQPGGGQTAAAQLPRAGERSGAISPPSSRRLDIGVESLKDMGRRYTARTDWRRPAGGSKDQSERAMRAAISAMPDGTHEFEDFVDDDGIDRDKPLRIHARDDRHPGRKSRSICRAPALRPSGPVNCTYNMTDSAVVCGVMMSVGSDIPANAGCYRPIRDHRARGACASTPARRRRWPIGWRSGIASSTPSWAPSPRHYRARSPRRITASAMSMPSTPSRRTAAARSISIWNAAAGAPTPMKTAPAGSPAVSTISPTRR